MVGLDHGAVHSVLFDFDGVEIRSKQKLLHCARDFNFCVLRVMLLHVTQKLLHCASNFPFCFHLNLAEFLRSRGCFRSSFGIVSGCWGV